MDIHNEVGTGLKVSLLMFGLILVGTLLYFVVRQNNDLGLIYAAQDVEAVIVRQNPPPKVDNTNPSP